MKRILATLLVLAASVTAAFAAVDIDLALGA